ncbi:DUF2934 domain-containing protein [Caballeronia sp. Lep1P3]|uniref:DUF2934 domain-containing protein n=1 Tax=Caballeronia sp. Lep1P3 TaxID=2878150 RepID=UPI001FD355A2|nr:DUF2934 domain-containing protein [Caballeronia sp. Lep1P3]
MAATFNEEEVRECAYRLWEADGRREGRDDHYWYLAIQLLEEQARLSEGMSESIGASPSVRERKVATSKQAAPKKLSGLTDAQADADRRVQATPTADAKKAEKVQRRAVGSTVGRVAAGKKKAAA